MKRVMVYQKSRVEIIYSDLYMGLGLKLEDLSKYDTPLVGFDGRIVTPKGQIKLLVVTEGKRWKLILSLSMLSHPTRQS